MGGTSRLRDVKRFGAAVIVFFGKFNHGHGFGEKGFGRTLPLIELGMIVSVPGKSIAILQHSELESLLHKRNPLVAGIRDYNAIRIRLFNPGIGCGKNFRIRSGISFPFIPHLIETRFVPIAAVMGGYPAGKFGICADRLFRRIRIIGQYHPFRIIERVTPVDQMQRPKPKGISPFRHGFVIRNGNILFSSLFPLHPDDIVPHRIHSDRFQQIQCGIDVGTGLGEVRTTAQEKFFLGKKACPCQKHSCNRCCFQDLTEHVSHPFLIPCF